MKGGAVAKRYARALLALARENGDPTVIGEALGRAACALAAPEVAEIARSPAVGAGARMAVVRRVVGALGAPQVVANCLYLLAERRRLDIVETVWQAYLALLDEALGRGRVTVRSAVPLPEARLAALLAEFRELTGAAELVPRVEVDPNLLGGVVIETNGVVYDGSVRTQVSRLARRMTATGDTPG
jgi:F-type H+-transporting ATPase subunit delta